MVSENLPPVIEILINENLFGCNSPEDLKNKFSDAGLVKDLMQQAEWTNSNFSYFDDKEIKLHNDFSMIPSITISPFPFKIGLNGCVER